MNFPRPFRNPRILAVIPIGLVLGVWSATDAFRYTRIAGVRTALALPPVPDDYRLVWPEGDVYTWREPAAEVVTRANALLTPERGWKRETTPEETYFVRVRPAFWASLNPIPLWGSHDQVIDRVVVYTGRAYPSSGESHTASPPAPEAEPWTTLTVDTGREREFFICGMEPVFKRIRLARTPRSTPPPATASH